MSHDPVRNANLKILCRLIYQQEPFRHVAELEYSFVGIDRALVGHTFYILVQTCVFLRGLMLTLEIKFIPQGTVRMTTKLRSDSES